MKKLTIALALTAAVCCSAQNLVKNAEFQEVDQNGKLAEWTYKPSECTLVKSEDGRQVVTAQVTPPPEGEQKTRTSVHLHQTIQLPQTGKYQLTLVGKVDGTGLINCSWTFFDQNRVKIPVKKNWSNGISGRKEGWQTASQVLDVPEGAKTMAFRVTSYAERQFKHEGATTFIKQVSLEPLPGDAAGK